MLKKDSILKNRNLYLKKLLKFKDKDVIKIITGIRRCGKSSLMKLMINYLLDNGIQNEQIVYMNFESMNFRNMSQEKFYSYVKEMLPKNRKVYLFFDEVHRVEGWQDVINSFRVDFECDIYITGSNAYLLSGEYATYLAGRSVEIKVYPLSFSEFIDFHGYEIVEKTGLVNKKITQIRDEAGDVYDVKELLEAYLMFGGMPGIADIGLELEKVVTVLDGIYSSVVMRDILERERQKGRRQITDPYLLRKITMFLADNIGNTTSITSISNTLLNEKLIDNGFKNNKAKPAVQTVHSYILGLLEAYVFYEIKRYDIKGKEYLKTLGKYYIADIGLRNYLLGFKDTDRGRIIENIVYFELLRRGYDISIGKIGEREVDFIITDINTKKYIQVTESMNSQNTREREFAPFYKIDDNYEKIIITNDEHDYGQDGIKVVKLSDFLLEVR